MSLAAEGDGMGHQSNLSVWKRFNESVCKWLSISYPISFMEMKQHSWTITQFRKLFCTISLKILFFGLKPYVVISS